MIRETLLRARRALVAARTTNGDVTAREVDAAIDDIDRCLGLALGGDAAPCAREDGCVLRDGHSARCLVLVARVR